MRFNHANIGSQGFAETLHSQYESVRSLKEAHPVATTRATKDAAFETSAGIIGQLLNDALAPPLTIDLARQAMDLIAPLEYILLLTGSTGSESGGPSGSEDIDRNYAETIVHLAGSVAKAAIAGPGRPASVGMQTNLTNAENHVGFSLSIALLGNDGSAGYAEGVAVTAADAEFVAVLTLPQTSPLAIALGAPALNSTSNSTLPRASPTVLFESYASDGDGGVVSSSAAVVVQLALEMPLHDQSSRIVCATFVAGEWTTEGVETTVGSAGDVGSCTLPAGRSSGSVVLAAFAEMPTTLERDATTTPAARPANVNKGHTGIVDATEPNANSNGDRQHTVGDDVTIDSGEAADVDGTLDNGILDIVIGKELHDDATTTVVALHSVGTISITWWVFFVSIICSCLGGGILDQILMRCFDSYRHARKKARAKVKFDAWHKDHGDADWGAANSIRPMPHRETLLERKNRVSDMWSPGRTSTRPSGASIRLPSISFPAASAPTLNVASQAEQSTYFAPPPANTQRGTRNSLIASLGQQIESEFEDQANQVEEQLELTQRASRHSLAAKLQRRAGKRLPSSTHPPEQQPPGRISNAWASFLSDADDHRLKVQHVERRKSEMSVGGGDDADVAIKHPAYEALAPVAIAGGPAKGGRMSEAWGHFFKTAHDHGVRLEDVKEEEQEQDLEEHVRLQEELDRAGIQTDALLEAFEAEAASGSGSGQRRKPPAGRAAHRHPQARSATRAAEPSSEPGITRANAGASSGASRGRRGGSRDRGIGRGGGNKASTVDALFETAAQGISKPQTFATRAGGNTMSPPNEATPKFAQRPPKHKSFAPMIA